MWHKYVNIEVLNYNTSYHTSISEPSQDFNGRIVYNIFDLNLGIRPQQQPIPTSQIAQKVPEQKEMIHQDVRKNAIQAYIKFKAYYDKKAKASKLKKEDYLYALQPKAIIKEVNFRLRNFGGLALILLKSVAQQQLPGTQNWHQQDASAPRYADASGHTPPNPTRYTNHATRMETWSGNEPQTR